MSPRTSCGLLPVVLEKTQYVLLVNQYNASYEYDGVDNVFMTGARRLCLSTRDSRVDPVDALRSAVAQWIPGSNCCHFSNSLC